MRALRKGQARVFNLTRDPIGEKRMIEPAFGVGPCVMEETMAWLEEQLAA
jgi:transposase, IS6 family